MTQGTPAITSRRWLGTAVAALVLATQAPAAHAATTITVTRTVKGAQVARFTLSRPIDLTFKVTADRPTPLYGLMLAQVGSDRYLVDLIAAGYEREFQMGYDMPPAPNNPLGAHLIAGTYDLTLFSQATATIRARLTGALPALHFSNKTLQAFTTTSTDTSAKWEHDFPVSLAKQPHGAVVYMQDEWTGDGRNGETVCVWQTSRCPAINQDALDGVTSSDDGMPGAHRSLYGEGLAADDLPPGQNTVTVQTIVVGQATRHMAVLLIVP